MARAAALLLMSLLFLDSAVAAPVSAPSTAGTPPAATTGGSSTAPSSVAPAAAATAQALGTAAIVASTAAVAIGNAAVAAGTAAAVTGAAVAPATPADRNPDAAPPAVQARFVDRFRDRASDMVLTAMNFLGTPYRRGGSTADHGFDCSGFTRHVFEMSLGLVLPRRADEQASAAGLLRIDRAQLRPGDLVFFNTMRRTFSHVGIYVGAGKFIHSPKPGGEVRVDDLQAGYWDRRFTGGRRVEPAGRPLLAAPDATGSSADAPAVN